MFFNNNFPVYCICLPKRKERCHEFFKRLNFQVIYPDIVKKKDINCPEMYENNIISKNYKCQAFLGKIACSLSHVKVLQNFLKTKHNYCLIFEDDNRLLNKLEVNRVHNVLNKILNKYKSWNLINLSPCWSICSIQSSTNIHSNVYKSLNSVCRNAYAITKNGAKEFIKNAFPLTNGYLGGDTKMKLVKNSFDVHPSLFYQDRRNIKSSIGTNNYLTECTETTFQYKFLSLSLLLAIFILKKINFNNLWLIRTLIYEIIIIFFVVLFIQIKSYVLLIKNVN